MSPINPFVYDSLDTEVYDCVVFRSDATAAYLTAWPGIYMFQAGAVWTRYLHEGDKQRAYDVFLGDIDELTAEMAERGFSQRAFERRG